MWLTKIKLSGALVLAVCIVGGSGGWLAHRSLAAGEPGAQSRKGPDSERSKQENDADQTAPGPRWKRTVRWQLDFSTDNGEDYARQLAALGATVATPEGEGETRYRLFRDLSQRPARGEVEDIVNLDDQLICPAGAIVVLEFFGYWCYPCVSRMPQVFELHDKYHDKGLTVIGVHVDLGNDEGILAFFYDSGLSASVSFEPEATADADRFARERVTPRLSGGPDPMDAPLAVIATDGELYGHHQQFRDLFLQRLVAPDPEQADRGFDVVTLEELATESTDHAHHPMRIAERRRHGVRIVAVRPRDERQHQGQPGARRTRGVFSDDHLAEAQLVQRAGHVNHELAKRHSPKPAHFLEAGRASIGYDFLYGRSGSADKTVFRRRRCGRKFYLPWHARR
jgi:thiol-disulfide isomerase/thioredoxin